MNGILKSRTESNLDGGQQAGAWKKGGQGASGTRKGGVDFVARTAPLLFIGLAVGDFRETRQVPVHVRVGR